MSAANTPSTSGQPPRHNNSTGPGSWTTIEPPKGYSSSYPMGSSGYPVSPSTYQPTAEQLARDEARRRYLRRNVYLPVILAVVLVLALFILIVSIAFLGANIPSARSFIMGMSGLIVILTAIPLIAFMSVLPIAWLAYKMNQRQQRQLNPETGPMAYRDRLQKLLWRLESLLGQANQYAERGGDALHRPIVKAHATADYLKGFQRGIKQNFKRSNPHEFEQQ